MHKLATLSLEGGSCPLYSLSVDGPNAATHLRAEGTSSLSLSRSIGPTNGRLRMSCPSATMLNPSSDPTAAKGTIVASKRAAMRTNSALRGQNRRYCSPLPLYACRTNPDSNQQGSSNTLLEFAMIAAAQYQCLCSRPGDAVRHCPGMLCSMYNMNMTVDWQLLQTSAAHSVHRC